jgi:CheY-like chemotaxis protein
MQQPGSASATRFAVPTRNLSAAGMSFLHGGFVHIGTKCMVQLISTHGAWQNVDGAVVRCRLLSGHFHDVAIKFTENVEPGDFAASARKCRVLLAEDDELSARLAMYYLQQLSAEVDRAKDGQEAVQLAKANRYELILMDVEMPLLDGLAATQLLRKEGYSGIIVAVTAMTQAGDMERCILAGCNRYLAKPLQRDSLANLVALLKKEPLISTLQDNPALHSLVRQFVAELPTDVRAIEDALARQDYDQLQRTARALKAKGAGYGFDPITDAARRLEDALIENLGQGEVSKRADALLEWCLLAR